MKGKKWFALLKILLVAFLCFTFIAPAFAQTIDQKRDELNDVKRELSDNKKELNEYKSQEEQIADELRLIEAQLKQAEEELAKINREIRDTEKAIQVKEEAIQVKEEAIHKKEEQIQLKVEEIAEVEAWLAEQDELVKTRIRAIYENGSISYLEVLLASSGFSDFLTRFNYLRDILNSDIILFNEIKVEREKLEMQKEELEIQRQELEIQRRELEVQRNELENQRQGLLRLRKSQLDKQGQIDRQSRERSRILSQVKQAIEAQEKAIRDLERESKQIEALINKLLEEQKKESGAAPSGQLAWPVPGYTRITSYFGNRIHPITRQASFHSGIDIGAPRGVPIVAAESGTVILARYYGGYGNCVIIDHGGGMVTVYAHAHTLNSSVGQNVSRGQRIAVVGSTGFSTGPHLHFEVRINGQTRNPLNYLR